MRLVNPWAEFCVHRPDCTCEEESRERWLILMVLLSRDPERELVVTREEALAINPDNWEIVWYSGSSGDVFYKLIPKTVIDVSVSKERKLLS